MSTVPYSLAPTAAMHAASTVTSALPPTAAASGTSLPTGSTLSGVTSTAALPVNNLPTTGVNTSAEDLLFPFLHDLKSRNAGVRLHASQRLEEWLEACSRDLPPANFLQIMNGLNKHVFTLVNKDDIGEKLAGITLMAMLLPLGYEELELQFQKYVSYLKMIYNQKQLTVTLQQEEYEILMRCAATTLARMCQIAGSAATDVVITESKRCTEWLGKSERRLASLLIFAAFAEHVPNLFNSQVNGLLKSIWIPLKDSKLHIREVAAETLTSVIRLISTRAARFRSARYANIYSTAQQILTSPSSSVEAIHGALLALGPLLDIAVEFVLPRIGEVGDLVWELRSHSNKLIREQVMILLPQLAARDGDMYMRHYVRFVIGVIRSQTESRVVAFRSLGRLAESLGGRIEEHMQVIVQLVQDALANNTASSSKHPSSHSKKDHHHHSKDHSLSSHSSSGSLVIANNPNASSTKPYVQAQEAVMCLAQLATAVGQALSSYLTPGLIDLLLRNGLSTSVVEALSILCRAIPQLLATVQPRLLSIVSNIFNTASMPPPTAGSSRSAISVTRSNSLLSTPPVVRSSPSNPNLAAMNSPDAARSLVSRSSTVAAADGTDILLALQCLAIFPFAPSSVAPLLRGSVVAQFDHEQPTVRLQAVHTTVRIIQRILTQHSNGSSVSNSTFTATPTPKPVSSVNSYSSNDMYSTKANSASALPTGAFAFLQEVLSKLLMTGLTDSDPTIRRTVIHSLTEDMDDVLYNSPNLSTLLVLSNDEMLSTRESALQVLGRIALKHPTMMLPPLRQTITALVAQLQQTDHSNTRQREEAARLIRVLILSGKELLSPYVPSLLDTLLPRLHDPDSRVAAASLSALAELTSIAGDQINGSVEDIVSMIISILLSPNSVVARDLTLSCLATIIRNTGYVITPYTAHPQLLPTLLNFIRSGQSWAVRREAIRLLGTCGAYDPYKFKLQQKLAAGKVTAIQDQAATLVNAAVGQQKADGKQLLLAPAIPAPVSPSQNKSRAAADEAASGNEFDTEAGRLSKMASSAMHPGLQSIGMGYYPVVAIHSLSRILRDASLTSHHSKAAQSAMLILRSQGQRGCISVLPIVIPTILHVSAIGEESLRAALLADLSLIVTLARHHIKPYLPQIYTAIRFHWNDRRLLIAQLFPLLERIAYCFPSAMEQWLPSLLPDILRAMHEDRSVDRSLTVRILRAIESFGKLLHIHLHLVLPAVMRAAEQFDSPVAVRIVGVRTIGRLATVLNLREYATRVVHPLARLLELSVDGSVGTDAALHTSSAAFASIGGVSKTQLPLTPGGVAKVQIATPLADEVLNTMSLLLLQMRSEFVIYIPVVQRVLTKQSLRHTVYDSLVYKLLHNYPLTLDDLEPTDNNGKRGSSSQSFDANTSFLFPSTSMQALIASDEDFWQTDSGSATRNQKLPVNVAQLHRAWEVSHRSSSDDWLDWQRTLTVELLKESPSIALRHCAGVAVKHEQLGRDLFNAAFLSCWTELPDAACDELIHAIESACQASNLPPDIAQIILNLCEFMERDGQTLDINTKILSSLAERNLSYAKALHYAEREFQTSPSSSAMIESLISIHNHLQQPDAALGLLTYAENQAKLHPHTFKLKIKENWYESLNRYEDALEQYEIKQVQNLIAGPLPTATTPTNSFSANNATYNNTGDIAITVGRMRCLRALGEWDRLDAVGNAAWVASANDMAARREIAPLAAAASWRQGKFEQMPQLLQHMDIDRPETEWLRAVHAIHMGDYADAQRHIESCRQLVDPELTALVSESYDRAYKLILFIQQAEELEEVIEYKLSQNPHRKHRIRGMWRSRLAGVQSDVDVWQTVLSGRSLVLSYQQEMQTWVKFSSICRKSGRLALSLRVLSQLMNVSPTTHDGYPLTSTTPTSHSSSNGAASSVFDFRATPPARAMSFVSMQPTTHPYVAFSYIKHLWAADLHDEAFAKLKVLSSELEKLSPGAGPMRINRQVSYLEPCDIRLAGVVSRLETIATSELQALRAKAYIKVGEWESHLNERLDEPHLQSILHSFQLATQCVDTYKAWHHYAGMNYRAVAYYKQKRDKVKEHIQGLRKHMKHSQRHSKRKGYAAELERDQHKLSQLTQEMTSYDQRMHQHVVPSLQAFFKAIQFSGKERLQDMLRLLHLWFEHGTSVDVVAVLRKGFAECAVNIWLSVVPQIIARIDSPHESVRRLISQLLQSIGATYPQALLYPLTVTAASVSSERQVTAIAVLDNMRSHSPRLVDDAMMVSRELIRISVLWNEQWSEALEDASKAWFGAKRSVEAMFETLAPLHKQLKKPETLREISFVQQYGGQLRQAWEWCRSYVYTGFESDISAAWDIYLTVYRAIQKNMQVKESQLDMQYIAPALLNARNLLLAMPGTFLADRDAADSREVLIGGFSPGIRVLDSKQKPRKVEIHGDDGVEYSFLLKGHEDLRQDKRVMQLLALVNTFVESDRQTTEQDLSIRHYAVIPLSPDSGLIQWLHNCDTLHSLVKTYRETKNIIMNIENLLIASVAPLAANGTGSAYSTCTTIQKCEAFDYALTRTSGSDLSSLLWLSSSSSEAWLERRTAYTRSLAVMSMVGYMLGLGDRHPCNLMIERSSGKIVHIDFGDCFEVAQKREKFPERVPFRLTRMMVNAMEVSGIEGSFRTTCQNIMRLMRENKESIMAVLEAFVYDPLISWRLVEGVEQQQPQQSSSSTKASSDTPSDNGSPNTLNRQSSELAGSTTGSVADGFRKPSALTINDEMDAAADEANDPLRTDNNNAPVRPHSVNRRASTSRHKRASTIAFFQAKVHQAHQLHTSRVNGEKPTTELYAQHKQPDVQQANGVNHATNGMNGIGPKQTTPTAAVAVAAGPLSTDNDNEEVGLEVLNKRALEVIGRVEDKLHGRDFDVGGTGVVVSISDQVDLLIGEATSTYNLAQCYIGWCPMW